jgi:hypothetical protein
MVISVLSAFDSCLVFMQNSKKVHFRSLISNFTSHEISDWGDKKGCLLCELTRKVIFHNTGMAKNLLVQ